MEDESYSSSNEEDVMEEELSERLYHLRFPADDIIQDDFEEEEIDEEISEFELERLRNEKHNFQECEILKLPIEILALICRYVATQDLDFKSIENMSEVCSHFYVLARDPTLWRAACQLIWAKNVSMYPFLSWRSMYLDKPHVWVNGVYISRTSYVRSGDDSALTQCYRPYYIVEYCRFLRFFSNGRVFMLTTANDPAKMVSKLQNQNRKMQGLLHGKFTVDSETKTKKYRKAIISARLSPYNPPKDTSGMRYNNRHQPTNPSETIYDIKLELTSSSNKFHFNKLIWMKHSCTTIYPKTNEKNVLNFNLSNQYPPLYYSAVKSYTANSMNAL